MTSGQTLTRKYILQLCALFLVWRTLLFGIGIFADQFLIYSPSFPYWQLIAEAYHLPRWLGSWANFDGVHYLTIAQEGYGNFGLVQAFFPMYPYLILRPIFLLSDHKINTLLLGLFISNLAALVAMIVWFGFLLQEYGKSKAWLGVIFFLCFPTALFWGALYTESLFFAAIIAAFWAARSKRWGIAMVCTIIATATRIVGIFLVPALLLELWLQWREVSQVKQPATVHALILQLTTFCKKHWLTMMIICAGSLGLVSYMAYLQYRFGDALFFLHVQNSFGAGRQSKMVLYPQVVWRSIKILLTLRPFDWRYYTAILEFLAGTFGFLGLVIAYFRKVRISYIVFGFGAFLLPPLTGTFSSMPRYLLVCFPLYLLLIELSARFQWLKFILIPLFWLSLCINVILFVQGYWVS